MTYQSRQQVPTQPRAGWIYTGHFGLREAPFTMTPDTRFFLAHPSCQVAVNTLMISTRSGEGFTKIVGEVGTGKTLLCRKFLCALDENFVTAYLPNPYLEPMTLLLAIADELGVPYPDNVNQHQLLKALNNFLIETYAEHRCTTVVCLDEAHALPIETLEVLRYLSNMETRKRKLLQLVLFGQPELDEHLNQPSIRQLKQRISFSCALKPRNRKEVEDYIIHRLSVAGYAGSKRIFKPSAIRLLYRGSRGIPRLVNILAHKAMMAAFGQGSRHVTRHHVRLAIEDTESAQLHAGGGQRRWLKYAGGVISSLLVSAGAVIWGGGK